MLEEPQLGEAVSNAKLFNRHLCSNNDVVRNMAVQALPALGFGRNEVRHALLEALSDPDPDTRADAMAIFGKLVMPEDARFLRSTLKEDPVREVKLSAIAALSRLQDRGSIVLLRGLVNSRCEEDFAWEEEASDWEDWLDIQVAVIEALGHLGATQAIDDLMAARQDEFGQNLDIPVFKALGQMGSIGAAKLIEVLKEERGLAKTRAVRTLSKLAPDVLQDHRHLLVGSDEPLLRQAAVPLFAASSNEIEQLIKGDPDPSVRIAALRYASTDRPELTVGCLIDADQTVQAAALELIQMPLPASIRDALSDNMLAWMKTAPPALKMASVKRLADIAPERAADALLAVIADKTSPLEIRVCAVQALDDPSLEFPTSALCALLSNPAQQVRVKTLSVLKSRALSGDEDSVTLIAGAISGAVLDTADDPETDRPFDEGMDVSAPKDDAIGPRNIIITQDGEIVESKSAGKPLETGQSTLSSILKGTQPGENKERGNSGAKQRKRRSVEGPDAVASALRIEAIRTGADLQSPHIRAALLGCLDEPVDALQREVWSAFERQMLYAVPERELLAAARNRIAHSDPVVKLAAFRIVTQAGKNDEIVGAALKDEDALLRAAAVSLLAPGEAAKHLADEVSVVRDAALEQVLCGKGMDTARHAADILIQAERIDTLAKLLTSSTTIAQQLKTELLTQEWPAKKTLIILSSFSRSSKDKQCQDITS